MSLCNAARTAAALSVTIDANDRATINVPHVVVKRDVVANAPHLRAFNTQSTEFPGHAVVARAAAQQDGVPIIWDPWSGLAAGAVVANDTVPRATYPMDLVVGATYRNVVVPPACRAVLAPQTNYTPWLVGGGLVLVIGVGAYFALRD